MPNRSYNRARAYESDLVNWHRGQPDCLYATRTPGSKTPVDVVAVYVHQGDPLKPITDPTYTHVHMIQCKLGTSRPKQSEIDFLKFMREKGCEAYFVTREANRKFYRLELEEVEDEAIDDGSTDEDITRTEAAKKMHAKRKK